MVDKGVKSFWTSRPAEEHCMIIWCNRFLFLFLFLCELFLCRAEHILLWTMINNTLMQSRAQSLNLWHKIIGKREVAAGSEADLCNDDTEARDTTSSRPERGYPQKAMEGDAQLPCHGQYRLCTACSDTAGSSSSTRSLPPPQKQWQVTTYLDLWNVTSSKEKKLTVPFKKSETNPDHVRLGTKSQESMA